MRRNKATNLFEDHFYILMNTVIDGVIIVDSAAVIQAFNPAAERIFGYRPDQAIGQNVKLLMPEPYHSEHDRYLTNYLTSGEQQLIGIGRSVTGRRSDGSLFPMELGVNEMEVAGQRMFVGTIRDVSEREEAARRTREDAARMQAIMNTVQDGLITIDQKGTIQTFNRASVKMFGYLPDEVIGQNVRMLMPEPYRTGHDQYLRNYLETGAAKVIGIGREVRARRKDGTTFPMDLSVNEMHIVGKRLFIGIVRDITARQHSDRVIEEFTRSNQELDDFAYIASHDLKEPLRGLSNNALFLKEDFADVIGETGSRRITRITFLCERMERLVDDLLYFSRLDRQDLAIQEANLNSVIADVAMMMESTLEETNATIVVPAPLPVIVCDLPRITEVFRNLITNAVKYNTNPEKRVEIGCTESGGKNVFYVRDNGIGIPAQFHGEIFRMFKRLNDEDDKARGTGVGLTFVKKIIERHGGEVRVESEVGQGSTFYFSINQNRKV